MQIVCGNVSWMVGYLYRRAPFLRATNFVNGKFGETIFMYESTMVPSLQSAIHVTIEFPLIFSETNFMEIPKSTKSTKFVALEKKVPYGNSLVTLLFSPIKL